MKALEEEKFNELLEGMVEGRLNKSELEQLRFELQDEERRQKYVEQAKMHSMLRDISGALDDQRD